MLYKGKNKDSKIIFGCILGRQISIDTEHCSVGTHGKFTEKEKVIKTLVKAAPTQQKRGKKIPAGTTESSPLTVNTGKSGRKFKISEIFLNWCERQAGTNPGQPSIDATNNN